MFTEWGFPPLGQIMSWIFFLVVNPFTLFSCLAVSIAFSISWEYLGLWIASVIGIWAIILFPFNRPYTDANFDFFGDFFIYSVNLILVVGFAIAIVTRIIKNQNQTKNRSASKLGLFLSSCSCGILSAYFSYLFLTELWHNHQPTWQAHGLIILEISLIVICCFIVQRRNRIYDDSFWGRNILTFMYSFSTVIAIAIISNLFFPIFTINQTINIVDKANRGNIKYCIQSNRKPLRAWLDLSPLTAWNKPSRNKGAALRHAVLVLEKDSEYLIYYWSYRLIKWVFVSREFKPGAFTVPDQLECKPEKNYASNLPYIFPK